VSDVEKEAFALLLPVIGDIDTRFGLLAEDRMQRLSSHPFELGGIDGFASGAAHVKTC
jgi:hypothetical protein